MHESVAAVWRYLDALAAFDWSALAATLSPNVVRLGPYRDDFIGREPYVEFLRTTISSLGSYRLEVDDVWSDGAARVCAELCETATIPATISTTGGDAAPRRLATDEVILFCVDDDGLIERVAVFLQRSSSV